MTSSKHTLSFKEKLQRENDDIDISRSLFCHPEGDQVKLLHVHLLLFWGFFKLN